VIKDGGECDAVGCETQTGRHATLSFAASAQL